MSPNKKLKKLVNSALPFNRKTALEKVESYTNVQIRDIAYHFSLSSSSATTALFHGYINNILPEEKIKTDSLNDLFLVTRHKVREGDTIQTIASKEFVELLDGKYILKSDVLRVSIYDMENERFDAGLMLSLMTKLDIPKGHIELFCYSYHKGYITTFNQATAQVIEDKQVFISGNLCYASDVRQVVRKIATINHKGKYYRLFVTDKDNKGFGYGDSHLIPLDAINSSTLRTFDNKATTGDFYNHSHNNNWSLISSRNRSGLTDILKRAFSNPKQTDKERKSHIRAIFKYGFKAYQYGIMYNSITPDTMRFVLLPSRDHTVALLYDRDIPLSISGALESGLSLTQIREDKNRYLTVKSVVDPLDIKEIIARGLERNGFHLEDDGFNDLIDMISFKGGEAPSGLILVNEMFTSTTVFINISDSIYGRLMRNKDAFLKNSNLIETLKTFNIKPDGEVVYSTAMKSKLAHYVIPIEEAVMRVANKSIRHKSEVNVGESFNITRKRTITIDTNDRTHILNVLSREPRLKKIQVAFDAIVSEDGEETVQPINKLSANSFSVNQETGLPVLWYAKMFQGVLRTKEQEMKWSKFFSYLIKDSGVIYKDEDLELANSLVMASYAPPEIEIIEGNKIGEIYKNPWEMAHGTVLQKSCMNGKSYPLIYNKTPNLRMAICKNGDTLKGRALLWTLQDKHGKEIVFMDRVYAEDHRVMTAFLEMARKKGFISKTRQSYDAEMEVVHQGYSQRIRMGVLIPQSPTYPYLDTFKYTDLEVVKTDKNGNKLIFATNVYGGYKLNKTDGSYGSCDDTMDSDYSFESNTFLSIID